MSHRLALLVCAFATVSVDALSACEAPQRMLESAEAIVERQFSLSWKPVPGATAYRIRLLSRVPNGRVLAQHDAVVNEPRFFPPQPLADYRAKVTVRLASICSKETSAESVSWFMIDTSAACSGEVRAETRAHAFSDGRLITAQESRTTPHVLSTRPLCAGARGEAAYRVTAGD